MHTYKLHTITIYKGALYFVAMCKFFIKILFVILFLTESYQILFYVLIFIFYEINAHVFETNIYIMQNARMPIFMRNTNKNITINLAINNVWR